MKTYEALPELENNKEKNFCNTKTLNYLNTEVCLYVPPHPPLFFFFFLPFLSLASSATFNKSLVCSFFHLASFGFCLFCFPVMLPVNSSVIFSIFHILFTTGGLCLKSFTVFPTSCSFHLKLDLTAHLDSASSFDGLLNLHNGKTASALYFAFIF